MTPPVAILLMRHGQIGQEQPAPDGSRRFVGDRDLPLDDTGRAQGRAAAAILAGLPIRRVLASDLSRSLDTARLAVGLLDPAPLLRQDPGLREICIGRWQGLFPHEVQARTPGGWEARCADLARYRPPGGENYEDVAARALHALSRLARETEEAGDPVALAVAHAGVNRAVLCAALALPLSSVLALPQDYGCLNLLHWRDGRFSTQAVNLLPAALAPGWLAAYATG